ncbi:hypothetical protein GC163_05490 [bacterium]|nr:hypothetical protein [bacterium]
MILQSEALLDGPVKQFTSQLAEWDRQIDPLALPDDDACLAAITQDIDHCLAECAQLDQALADQVRVLRETQQAFREAIRSWFDKSPLMKHALAKPRGYAGDYQMLTCVYNGQAQGTGLGGYLDRYFLTSELGRAVPLRLNMAREFLIEEAISRATMTVLNIASGPGREYQHGWDLPEGHHVNVVCVDQDEAAIEFVEQTVIPTLPYTIELQMVRHNALKMGNARQNIELFGRRDVVYSIGLCDYIPDRLMIRLLSGWRESVAEGGTVYVAFKDCEQYSKTKYQWLVDWYFYQRTVEECRGLFALAGYDMEHLEMTRDTTGSIINFVARNLPAVSLSRQETTVEPAEQPAIAVEG